MRVISSESSALKQTPTLNDRECNRSNNHRGRLSSALNALSIFYCNASWNAKYLSLMNKTEFVCRFGRKKWDNFALVGWKILEGNYKRDARSARDRDNHCNHAKRLHVGIHTSVSVSC